MTLTVTPETGSAFAGWSGACAGTGTCTITMDAAKSVTATFNLQTFTLSVAKNGTGSGTVTSNIPGINCGTDCQDVYSFGTGLNLTATPEQGSVFTGWSGNCTGTSTTCYVYMNADKSVIATFDIMLTVGKTGAGSGVVTSSPPGINCGADCKEPYDMNTVVTLAAVADSGSVFKGWSGPADCSDGVVTMDVSKTCTAVFDIATGGWEMRYNGPNKGNDYATDIAVDNEGNIYVTGGSEGDYLTIKYDADGNKLWEARYNGTGNGADYAEAMAVDANGNVYVTGSSWGNDVDYATVKYNSGGVLQWEARYNGIGTDRPAALAIDGNGNVYVTGASEGTFWDYATIKYDANGNQIWVASYTTPDTFGFSYDQAKAIAVDAVGNVYVTGDIDDDSEYGTTDYGTIKYNSNGVKVWEARYGAFGYDNANAIAIDAGGNVYVTGDSRGDYATIKYNSNGGKVWEARYNSSNNGYDVANALVVDGNGNVYVTGRSADDYVTIKYAPDGSQLWLARYGGLSGSYDYASDIAVDKNGYVYVTGSSGGDYLTVKYDSNGNKIWEARYNGPGNGNDSAAALASGTDGIVYVTGRSQDTDGSYDYATLKYTTPPYILTVNRLGNGTVTSNDGGINCGNDCKEDYLSVTDITLTATPDAGSVFDGWSVYPDCSDGVVTMDISKSCTATFNIKTQLLGDMNNDGAIDISDVILVLRMALGLDTLNPCADINNDGVVDISDVILTLRMALGLDQLKQCN